MTFWESAPSGVCGPGGPVSGPHTRAGSPSRRELVSSEAGQSEWSGPGQKFRVIAAVVGTVSTAYRSSGDQQGSWGGHGRVEPSGLWKPAACVRTDLVSWAAGCPSVDDAGIQRRDGLCLPYGELRTGLCHPTRPVQSA